MPEQSVFGAHHGKKRPAQDESFEGTQRLTKRLNRLNLHPDDVRGSPPKQADPAAAGALATEEQMHLDDTKDRIYIHDLDAELAELEEEEKPTIEFLPEFEKKLATLPSLIDNRPLQPNEGQLVLYKPISLIDEVQDQTRKAIIEERRQKARETMHQRFVDSLNNTEGTAAVTPYQAYDHSNVTDDDPDAMELG